MRSRSIVGTIGAGIQSLFGGNITLWSEMCEHARQEAFELMARHAEQMGANAIIGVSLRRDGGLGRRHGGAGLRHRRDRRVDREPMSAR